MFIIDDKNISIISGSTLRNDVNNQTRKGNFIQNEKNHGSVNEQTGLQNRIESIEKIQFHFIKNQAELKGNRSKIEAYMNQIIEGRELLLMLINMIAEQSTRNSKILNIHHNNTAQKLMRNVFVKNGMMMIVSRYHKKYRISESEKVIHRYLPRAVGQMYVYYEGLIRPFQEMMKTMMGKKFTTSTLMGLSNFQNKTGIEVRMTNAMQKISRRGMGISVELQAGREMMINIARRYLRKNHAFRSNENDINDELNENHDVIYDEQTAHENHVVGMIYARRLLKMSGMIKSKRQRFREASIEWHKFLKLMNDSVTIGIKRKKRNFTIIFSMKRSKRLRRMNIDDKLREMLESKTQFRECQRKVIQIIMNEKNYVVMMMNTGEKKNLTFMMPTGCNRSGIRVMMMPLIALRQNMMKRCRKLKISCAEGSRQFSQATKVRLMFVIFESAVSEKFQTGLNRQRARGQLNRIFIDECHVMLNNQMNFREKLRKLKMLNQAKMQMIMLTATLPLRMKLKLGKRMWGNAAKIRLFRTRTSRENIKYFIIHIDDNENRLKQGIHIIQQAINRYDNDKMMMYCQFVVITQALANRLKCDNYYHHAFNKNEILIRFRQNQNMIVKNMIVIINAFEMKIDVNDIRIVFHIDRSRNMLNYAQKSERAKRDELLNEAIVVIRKNAHSWRDQSNSNNELVNLFMQNQTCKRQILDEYLNHHYRTQCEEHEKKCGVCDSEVRLNHKRIYDERKSIENDDAISISFDNDSLQTKQRERDETIENHRIQIQKENRMAEELRLYLKTIRLGCSFCRGVLKSKREHVLYHCRKKKTFLFKQRYVRLRKIIRKNGRMQNFGGCMTCYAPQTWCNRWVKVEGGKKNVGNWRSTEKKELCQLDEVLLNEYVMMLNQKTKLIQKRNERMRQNELDSKNEKNEKRYLGKQLTGAKLKINQLVEKLKKISKIGELNSGEVMYIGKHRVYIYNIERQFSNFKK